jgi:hypothetical protein
VGREFDKTSVTVSETSEFVLEMPCVATWRFKDRDCLGIIDYTTVHYQMPMD